MPMVYSCEVSDISLYRIPYHSIALLFYTISCVHTSQGLCCSTRSFSMLSLGQHHKVLVALLIRHAKASRIARSIRKITVTEKPSETKLQAGQEKIKQSRSNTSESQSFELSRCPLPYFKLQGNKTQVSSAISGSKAHPAFLQLFVLDALGHLKTDLEASQNTGDDRYDTICIRSMFFRGICRPGIVP